VGYRCSTLAVLLAVGATICPSLSYAECVCRCVSGEVRALCSSTLDLQPICPPQICPIVPPSIAPIQAPTLPPLGAKGCRQMQVLNPRTGQYEWQMICK
jgi:hypothetical protein